MNGLGNKVGVVAHRTAIVARMEKRFGVSFTALRRWALKGGWAVVDQGLFSGANFLVNILLARWLSPEEYGAFAVALSIFYLLAGFHTAALTEPMMVFGARRYKKRFRWYLGVLFYAHWGFSAIATFILSLAAFVAHSLGSAVMAEGLAGVAVSSPLVLLLWYVRRGCYAQLQPLWAAVGSGVNLLVATGGVLLLSRVGLLSSFSGLVSLGGAAGVASLSVLTKYLHPRLRAPKNKVRLRVIARDHWHYGSWNLLGVIAYWASGQVLMLLIPVFLGLAAGAAVAAVWNLYRPVRLLMQSLGLILLPTFSKWVSLSLPPQKIKERVLWIAFLFGGCVVLYSLFLTALAHPILHLVYQGKYDNYQFLVGLSAIPWVTAVIISVLVLGLKAYTHVREASMVWAYSAMLVPLIGVPAMKVYGLEGAIISVGASYVLTLAVAVVKLLKTMRGHYEKTI